MRIEVCTDCNLAHHGYTPDELGYTPEYQPWAREQDMHYTYVSSAGFSHWTCDACESPLAGDRFTYELLPEHLRTA